MVKNEARDQNLRSEVGLETQWEVGWFEKFQNTDHTAQGTKASFSLGAGHMVGGSETNQII